MKNTKVCLDCGKEKRLGEFNRASHRPDGRQGVCRECRWAYLASWRNGYSRYEAKRNIDSVRKRFFAKVNVDGPEIIPGSPCHLWIGSVDGHGYGRFYMPDKHVHPAQRIAYFLATGTHIPDDLDGCHHCDNPPCVRADHIFPGTRKENAADMAAKGRGATGDRSGARRHPEKRPRGAKHGRHVLTESEALSILQLWGAGGWTQLALAGRFHVNRATVSYLVNRKTWTHLRP